MNTWLIVSICLYIIGLLPALNWNIEGHQNPKWKIALETIFWPIVIPAVIIGMGIIELIVMFIRIKSKYFFILLLIAFYGCDISKRTDPGKSWIDSVNIQKRQIDSLQSRIKILEQDLHTSEFARQQAVNEMVNCILDNPNKK